MEKMAIILRFFYFSGFMWECFFDIVQVDDTITIMLKKKICKYLIKYNLKVKDMRDKKYDDASNMCGAWSGLQSLFRKESQSAYYVHCFANQLQLTLVASSNYVHDVWIFFKFDVDNQSY